MLKASGGGELTGIAAAIGVRAVLSGAVPAGVHHFAEALDARAVVDELRRDAGVTLLVLNESLADSEEGEL
jgi:hypothetical protein